jgi:dTDP-4-dehydrorhamnose reductase
MSSKKRIVILGKSGLLAQAAIKAAKDKKYEVFTLSRSNGLDLTGINVDFHLEEACKRIGPTLIFNAAGITDLAMCEQNPYQAWMLNARLPGLLARLTNQNQIPWVHISTDHYFNGDENLLHRESETPIPPNEYSLSKLAGEKIALTSSTALVLRTNIIGRRGWVDQPNFAEWAMRCLAEEIQINAYTDTWASSIESGQFAKLALELVESGSTGLMNLACSESISKSDWIEKIAIQSGFKTSYLNRVKTPKFIGDKLRRANSMGLDCTKAQQQLNKLGFSLPCSNEVVYALVKSFSE